MTLRVKVAAVAAVAVIGGGTAYAVAASAGPAQPSTEVYACVNQSGGIDYLEFRAPLPHPCWFLNEQLWQWAVGPAPAPTVSATSG